MPKDEKSLTGEFDDKEKAELVRAFRAAVESKVQLWENLRDLERIAEDKGFSLESDDLVDSYANGWGGERPDRESDQRILNELLACMADESRDE